PGRRGTRPPANPRSGAETTAARASPRPLLATADTPPTLRPSAGELDPAPLDPPHRPDNDARHHCGQPPAPSSPATGPPVARPHAATRPPPAPPKSPHAQPATIATANEPAPAAPAAAISGRPTPEDVPRTTFHITQTMTGTFTSHELGGAVVGTGHFVSTSSD